MSRQEPDPFPRVAIGGFEQLIRQAVLPQASAQDLHRELLMLGAVHVCELALSEWRACTAFMSLRPLEQKRLVSALPVQPQP